MQVVAKKYVLQSAMDKAFGIASKSSATPALQNVLLEANEHGCWMTGSDGEISTIVFIEQIEVAEPGSLMLPPKMHDIVKSCPDADISINSENGKIFISCEMANWELRQEQLEYPEIETPEDEVVEIPKEILADALTRCKPAISSENIRAMFAFVQVDKKRMRATDGSKFHQVDFDFPIDGLIPARAVAEVTRCIKSMALENVNVGQNERNYTFKFDSDLLIVTKHVAEYPDIDTHMLKPALAYAQRLSVDRKAFSDAVKRVSLTADPDTNYLVMEIADGKINLSTLDKYGNNSRESVEVYWEGNPRRLGVNHNYLMDMLSALAGAECVIMLGDDKPPRLTNLCFKDENFTGVLVQLRPDLGEAAKGSKRTRAAQEGPIGWKPKPKVSGKKAGKKSEALSALEEETPAEEVDKVIEE